MKLSKLIHSISIKCKRMTASPTNRLRKPNRLSKKKRLPAPDPKYNFSAYPLHQRLFKYPKCAEVFLVNPDPPSPITIAGYAPSTTSNDEFTSRSPSPIAMLFLPPTLPDLVFDEHFYGNVAFDLAIDDVETARNIRCSPIDSIDNASNEAPEIAGQGYENDWFASRASLFEINGNSLHYKYSTGTSSTHAVSNDSNERHDQVQLPHSDISAPDGRDTTDSPTESPSSPSQTTIELSNPADTKKELKSILKVREDTTAIETRENELECLSCENQQQVQIHTLREELDVAQKKVVYLRTSILPCRRKLKTRISSLVEEIQAKEKETRIIRDQETQWLEALLINEERTNELHETQRKVIAEREKAKEDFTGAVAQLRDLHRAERRAKGSGAWLADLKRWEGISAYEGT